MNNVTIRRLAAGDIDILKRLVQEAVEREPAAFGDSVEEWRNLPQARWARRLENPIFTAFLDAEPVGMAGLQPRRPERMAHRAILNSVYVRDDMRRSGVATRLLEAVADCARAQGLGWLELKVSAENGGAIALYRREGFVEIGRFPGGWLEAGRAIDEITMARRLDE